MNYAIEHENILASKLETLQPVVVKINQHVPPCRKDISPVRDQAIVTIKCLPVVFVDTPQFDLHIKRQVMVDLMHDVVVFYDSPAIVRHGFCI